MPTFRLSDIAARIGARLELAGGDDGLEATGLESTGIDGPEITGVSGIREAVPGQISFLANARYQPYAAQTRATALIVGPDFTSSPGAGPRFYLRMENPYLGFVHALRLFEGERSARPAGIHPSAVLGPDVTLGEDPSIGAHVVIEGGARIGHRAVIMPGCYIGAECVLGDDVTLHPNATVLEQVRVGDRVVIHSGAVLGSDGFGFVQDNAVKGNGVHQKIPQLGTVIVENDVEIGANTTIDRATTGVTRVEEGVKIDNLVQVGHNVVLGAHSLICAQVGISGSTQVGHHVVLAGQAGLAGHIKVGENAVVGGQAGVTKSVPANSRVSGYPAMEHDAALRVEAHARRLPELARELKALRSRLAQLEREIEKERERVL